MTDAHDLPFLHELVRQSDQNPSALPYAFAIAETLGIPADETAGIVQRLERRGLVTHNPRTRKMGAKHDRLALIVTEAGYGLVGVGPQAG